jgi:hypothetical protein
VREGKPPVEEYAVAELAASAEAAAAGLGVLVAALAGLTGPDAVGMSFDEVERQAVAPGGELLRLVVQSAMDDRAAREERLADVADAQGVPRPRAERGHARTVMSLAGPVAVSRIAYRAPGAANLHPADAVLSLPPRRQSWQVQLAIVGYALAGSYEQAQRFLLEATGIWAEKLQLEQIVADAARDAPAFYQSGERDGEEVRDRGTGLPVPLVVSADGKGVAMQPDSYADVRRRRESDQGGRARACVRAARSSRGSWPLDRRGGVRRGAGKPRYCSRRHCARNGPNDGGGTTGRQADIMLGTR